MARVANDGKRYVAVWGVCYDDIIGSLDGNEQEMSPIPVLAVGFRRKNTPKFVTLSQEALADVTHRSHVTIPRGAIKWMRRIGKIEVPRAMAKWTWPREDTGASTKRALRSSRTLKRSRRSRSRRGLSGTSV